MHMLVIDVVACTWQNTCVPQDTSVFLCACTYMHFMRTSMSHAKFTHLYMRGVFKLWAAYIVLNNIYAYISIQKGHSQRIRKIY